MGPLWIRFLRLWHSPRVVMSVIGLCGNGGLTVKLGDTVAQFGAINVVFDWDTL